MNKEVYKQLAEIVVSGIHIMVMLVIITLGFIAVCGVLTLVADFACSIMPSNFVCRPFYFKGN